MLSLAMKKIRTIIWKRIEDSGVIMCIPFLKGENKYNIMACDIWQLVINMDKIKS